MPVDPAAGGGGLASPARLRPAVVVAPDLEARGRIGKSAGGEEAEACEARKGDGEESDAKARTRGRLLRPLRGRG